MKICPKCNYQFNDTESFCNRCGTNLIQVQNPITKKKFTNSKAFVILCVTIPIIIFGIATYSGIKSTTNDPYYEPPVYGYIDTDEINVYIPEVKVIYSEMTNRSDGVWVQIYIENISKKTTIDNYKISIIYYNDENVMLNAEWETNFRPLEPNKKEHFIFHLTDVMFGSTSDVKSYKVAISYEN